MAINSTRCMDLFRSDTRGSRRELCDSYMSGFCAQKANKQLPICACMMMSEKYPFPQCAYTPCVENGYMTQGMTKILKGEGGKCPNIINCFQKQKLGNVSGSGKFNVNMEQNCGVTKLDSGAKKSLDKIFNILVLLFVICIGVGVIFGAAQLFGGADDMDIDTDDRHG